MQEYIQRNIDVELLEWKDNPMRKPLLLRGARQVGKSSAVRHFGKEFQFFAEVNFERHKTVKTFFQGDIDIRLIVQKIAIYINVPIEEGKTLLFLDEIQECPEAIMALRFFTWATCHCSWIFTGVHASRATYIWWRAHTYFVHVSDDI